MSIRAFLCFVEEDLDLVNLFRGQARNKALGLEFDDYSIKEPINSRNADYIKQQITLQIKLATITMCLYGPSTHTSEWVTWELNKTLELKKPIMGVRLYKDGRIKYRPSPLTDEWPRVDWDITQIVQTMQNLAAKYRGGF